MNYTEPKITNTKRGLIVYFTYNGKKFQYKKGINRYKGNRRLAEAEGLRKALSIRLSNGWNPNTPEVEKYHYTLIEAMEFALEKKKINVTHKTYITYKFAVNKFVKHLKKINLGNIEVENIKRSHIKLILQSMQDESGSSNKWYNKQLSFLKSIFSEIVQYDLLEFNPMFRLPIKKVLKVLANRPPTDAENEIIKNHLSKHYPNFFNYLLFEFYTLARPKEILEIRIRDIDFISNTITLKPENTKTSKERFIPINPHLLEILKNMNLENYNSDWYVFGNYTKEPKEKIDYSKRFAPSENHLTREIATKNWARIVKKGLKIDVNLYGYKKFGANKLILSGVPLESIKTLAGHESEVTTKIYATAIKEVHRREIISKAPKM